MTLLAPCSMTNVVRPRAQRPGQESVKRWPARATARQRAALIPVVERTVLLRLIAGESTNSGAIAAHKLRPRVPRRPGRPRAVARPRTARGDRACPVRDASSASAPDLSSRSHARRDARPASRTAQSRSAPLLMCACPVFAMVVGSWSGRRWSLRSGANPLARRRFAGRLRASGLPWRRMRLSSGVCSC